MKCYTISASAALCFNERLKSTPGRVSTVAIREDRLGVPCSRKEVMCEISRNWWSGVVPDRRSRDSFRNLTGSGGTKKFLSRP